VATCENVECGENHEGIWFDDYDMLTPYTPSTDWSQGGPIIERERISTAKDPSDAYWQACINCATSSMFGPGLCGDHWHYGPTPLIAAMRCYVASKLGDEVEIPEELK
jgi:hypothetical protein